MSNINKQSYVEYWLQRQERWLALIDHAAKIQREDLIQGNIQSYLASVDAMLLVL